MSGWTPVRAKLIALLVIMALSGVLALPVHGADTFTDVPAGHTFHDDIAWLAEEGVTRGCNPPANTRFCPDGAVTRGQMAAFLVRALGLPSADISFVDTVGHTFEADIAALAHADITRGCNPPDNDRFCPNERVTRGQMAAFLTRALNLPPGDAAFVDVDDSVFVADIEALASAGVTRGCNPPSNTLFCPGEHVTRAQMAAFLRRGIEGTGPVPPSVVMTGIGLGVAGFGEPIGEALPAIQAVLGQPDEDTGWLPPWGQFGACPGDAVRGVRWSHLQVLFVRSASGIEWAGLPPGEVLMSYVQYETLESGPVQPPLTTDRGIAVGDTVTQLRDAYGSDVTVGYDDIFEYWWYETTDGVRGSVSGPADDDVVQSIAAGTACGE